MAGRAWFDDADRPERRLAVHARPERGWITLSFWDGEECRATFHLPQEDAPLLVYELAAGLALGPPPADVPPPPGPPAPSWRGPLDTAANLLGRGSKWWQDRTGAQPPPPPGLRAVPDTGKPSGDDNSSG
jgi:hypothetical protein